MPVTITPENEVTLPTGGTVRLLDSAIRRDMKVSVVCDGCGQTLEWSQIDVADKPDALPPGAQRVLTLTTFDGKARVFCTRLCLATRITQEEAGNPPAKPGPVRIK